MPIRPENRARCPADWKAISKRIRHERAGNTCECTGECDDHDGRCDAPNGELILRGKADPARWVLSTEELFDALMGAVSGCCEIDEDYPWREPVKVVLTVAHLDHTPENCDDSNLRAMCQRCHLRYDAAHHATQRALNRAKKAGQGFLFPVDTGEE